MTDAPDERYTVRFWKALSAGRFLTHRCDTCSAVFFPPTPVCPHCGGQDVEWHEVSGRGSLYSFTQQRTAPTGFEPPLVIGTVELEAGPRLLAPVAAAYETLTIGTDVELVPTDYEWSYDRGALSDYPFFEAVPVAETSDASSDERPTQ